MYRAIQLVSINSMDEFWHDNLPKQRPISLPIILRSMFDHTILYDVDIEHKTHMCKNVFFILAVFIYVLTFLNVFIIKNVSKIVNQKLF